MSNQFISLFSGVGGGAFSARAAGYELVGAVEFDKKIADLYYENHQSMVLSQDVKDVDPTLFNVDKSKTLTVQLSPPCQEWSAANCNPDITSDRALALDNCYHILEHLNPDRIIIENVRAYQRSEPMDRFREWLQIKGYKYIEQVVNCADVGVPQNRIRYFLMAVRKGEKVRHLPLTHSSKETGQGDLFSNPLKPWIGWYEAIKDLMPDMQITKLSNNQQLALRGWDLSGRLLIPTIGYRSDLPPIYSEHRLAPTVKAMMMSDGESERKGCWRIVDNYEVREMSVRGLARLQTFPDDMILPRHKGLACKVIGNAVPSLIMQKILEECFEVL